MHTLLGKFLLRTLFNVAHMHAASCTLSCVHMDSLIRINMQVETIIQGGFNPHLMTERSQTWQGSEEDALNNIWSNASIQSQL